MTRKLLFIFVLVGIFSLGCYSAQAYVASSSNYRIESDSVNVGGADESTSTSYGLLDSIGQFVSGLSNSAIFQLNAGYRQGDLSAISVCDNDGICAGSETFENCPNDCDDDPPTGCTGPNCDPACSDGRDNDNDGFVDLSDPGCTGPSDDSEYNPISVPNVLNFQATYNSATGQIDLTWQNPAFAQFSAVRIMRMTAPSISGGPLEGILIYDGPGQSAVDEDVEPGTTYFYTAFVRDTNNPANYSSGAVDSATVPSEEEEEPEEPPCLNCDPFDLFPKGRSTSTLSLGDFQFIQNNQQTQFFSGGETIYVDGLKNLTVLLPYNRAPETLKIIGMTVFDSLNSGTSFSFILRVNQAKTAYSATFGQLAEGSYPFKIHFIDYQDQTVKVLSGVLLVRNDRSVLSVFGPVGEVGSKLTLGAGLVAGLLHLIFATSKVNSFLDIYLLLARFLGSLLGAFGLRKKRIPWGTVYDSVTKRPLDPAYVSLNQAGKEVSSAITDIDGRYGFFVAPGTYTLSAGKTHYVFPSITLAGKTQDELYANLYFGEEFTTTADQVINRNIPMDPVGFDWNEFAKTKKDFFQVHSRKAIIRERVFNIIFILGLILAIGEMAFLPSFTNLSVLGIYVFLVFAQVFWVAKHRGVSLKNLKTNEPLSFAVVKIYLPGTEQLIKKVVADELGRFYVLVPPGEYYLTVEEKLADQSYNLIYKSEPMKLKDGVIAKDIVIA